MQVAAQMLGVPLDSVFIAGTSSDIVPNSSPTAGSVGSDLYGGAVYNACLQLVERLQPYREKLPTGTFKVSPMIPFKVHNTIQSQYHNTIPFKVQYHTTGQGQTNNDIGQSDNSIAEPGQEI